ncbi:hypothetical protein Scep_025968 [Stephania cephalantha]|uniref:ARMC9 CTLH-like domain-containing protein n=1 Tax=Stephania cephalantha TaxID=152367 RepID=A0AAP0HPV4_9MAGN
MKYLFARPEHLVCSFTGKMGYMHYADELVKEFLVFRGFTNTLQTFETELSTDIGKGFQVDKILDLIFLEYVPKFQTEKLVGLLGFLKQYYSASIDTVFLSTLSKLEVSILRYFIIHALQSGRKEKVIEFFASNGNNLLLRSHEWVPWFAIPYLKSPNLDPQFRIYFSKEWLDAVHLSTRNFLSEMFNGTHILHFSVDDSDPYSCAFSFQAATSLPSTSIAFEKRSIPSYFLLSIS